MLQIFDHNALSHCKKYKLYRKIKTIYPSLIEINAEYVYFINLLKPINESKSDKLSNLLQDCTQNKLKNKIGQLIIITPRLGTISSWSSKATDIIHNAGISEISRIERGIIYYINSSSHLNFSWLNKIASMIYDQMTESIYFDLRKIEPFKLRHSQNTFKNIPILTQGKKALVDINKNLGLALSSKEINYLFNIFTKLNHDPNDIEIMMFAQINSEHCRHKIFKSQWIINEKIKKYSLFDMIKNTYKYNKSNILSAYKDNAAIISGSLGKRLQRNQKGFYYFQNEDLHIQIKVETHNHPTGISPYSGAATGVGGEIRDEAATGRGARTKAGLTGFTVSNLEIPGNIEPWEIHYGKPLSINSAFNIMLEAPIGSSQFNNEFGRPNLCGYFRTYQQIIHGKIYGYHKPIMIAGGYGNIKSIHVKKNIIPIGANIIVLGGPSMLIGLGGGAASSINLGHGDTKLDYASVQRSNPEMQRRAQSVIDACFEMDEKNPIISIHDVGAGGLSNALPELVLESELGAKVNLQKINIAEKGLSPLQLWCNESQERYVLAISQKNMMIFTKIAKREVCPYSVIGITTKEKNIFLHDENIELIKTPLSILFEKTSSLITKKVTVSKTQFYDWKYSNLELLDVAKRLLCLPTIGSKNFLITIGDRTVGGFTARDQMVGPWQVPVANSGVTAASYVNYYGEAMSIGERPALSMINPAAASRMTVGEAITNIACVDIGQLSNIKLSANWMASTGDNNEDFTLHKMVKTLGLEFCPELKLTIPVGKDSLSMKTLWEENKVKKSVTSPVSLIISAFSPVQDIRNTITPELYKSNNTVLILIDLGFGKNRLGGSCFSQVYNQLGKTSPDIKPQILKNFFDFIQNLIRKNKILAYHDRSDGGLFVTLCEIMFTARCGVTINFKKNIGNDIHGILFSEELGAVIQVYKSDVEDIISILNKLKLSAHIIGYPIWIDSTRYLKIIYNNKEIFSQSREYLQTLWSKTSYQIQKIRDYSLSAYQEYQLIKNLNHTGLFVEVPFNYKKNITAPYINHNIKPKVAILREQGVNGHNEMAAAFNLSGFDAIDVSMQDLKTGEKTLNEYKGLAVCGGFSYGDVLGAGGGWAKSIIFNNNLYDYFSQFFHRTDTFTIGICNGCQMLSQIKNLIPGAAHWPIFIQNVSEQFESRFIMVEILESSSIIFKEMQGLKMPIVISHSEGRTKYIQNNDMNVLISNQQTVMRYIDTQGFPTEYYPFNPNGSLQGFTGFTSKDGRVTIMMPHPERVFRLVQMSWYPKSWKEDTQQDYSPWMRLFMNARVWVN